MVQGLLSANKNKFAVSRALNNEIEFELESRLATALHNHDFIPLAKVFV